MATTTDELKRLHNQEADTASLKGKSSVQLKGFDYIEMYVGNASQAAYFYRAAFGFTPIAHCGLETGVRDRTSILIEQNDIRLVLTAALGPDHPIADHVKLHGDDVKDIAFTTDDAAHAFEVTVKRGAQPIMEPTVIEGEGGSIVKATVSAFGDTVHSFIQRNTADGVFFPNFQPLKNPLRGVPTGLTAIDHVAVSVEPDKLNDLVDYYNEVLDFRHTFTEDIETAQSSMNSKVVENHTGKIKFPIVEPAASKRRSQIEEYLTFHHGPGAQHIALATDNVIETVRALRANGNEFLHTPDAYYAALEERVGKIEEDVEALRELRILVDRDEWGYLMQIFTKPLQNRPTGFMEIIQRKRARGFGSGNIKALFQAIEREQSMRGNL